MDASATTALSRLRRMDLKELQVEYERVCGKPSKSRNREWLFKTVARALQGQDEPKSDQPAGPTITAKFERKSRSKNKTKTAKREKAAKVGKKPRSRVKPIGDRDPRLPKQGTVIERLYKKRKLLVTVEQDGFTFGGKSYRSLSALAQHITGAKAINGFLFFQLGDYAKVKKAGK